MKQGPPLYLILAFILLQVMPRTRCKTTGRLEEGDAFEENRIKHDVGEDIKQMLRERAEVRDKDSESKRSETKLRVDDDRKRSYSGVEITENEQKTMDKDSTPTGKEGRSSILKKTELNKKYSEKDGMTGTYLKRAGIDEESPESSRVDSLLAEGIRETANRRKKVRKETKFDYNDEDKDVSKYPTDRKKKVSSRKLRRTGNKTRNKTKRKGKLGKKKKSSQNIEHEQNKSYDKKREVKSGRRKKSSQKSKRGKQNTKRNKTRIREELGRMDILSQSRKNERNRNIKGNETNSKQRAPGEKAKQGTEDDSKKAIEILGDMRVAYDGNETRTQDEIMQETSDQQKKIRGFTTIRKGRKENSNNQQKRDFNFQYYQVSTCTKTYTVAVGRPFLLTSDGSRKRRKCRVIFKAPKGGSLKLSCPVMNLASSGCKREKLLVKADGRRWEFCKNNKLLVETSGEMLSIKHQRNKIRKKDCTGVFMCEVTLLSKQVGRDRQPSGSSIVGAPKLCDTEYPYQPVP
ncbi:uncharacterized protein [Panulirus ornatus]|uniref:uncharacterized protein n=1 Tax=Panulirus ornatus TaxID=150431 RepID=UPI003A8421C2